MYSIVVVDDERPARDFLEKYINENINDFHVVAKFQNGAEAIKFLDNNDVDIVISDVKMPIVDGLELAKYINENKCHTKVILVSAYEQFEYAQKAIKYNVFYYLTKMIDCEELENILTRMKGIIRHDKFKNNFRFYDDGWYSEKEIFFHEIMSGTLNDKKEGQQRLKEMNINLDFVALRFEALSIEIDRIEHILKNEWEYGKVVFFVAVQQLLDKVFNDIYVCYSYYHKEKMVCIIMYDDKRKESDSEVFEKYENQINQYLKINAHISKIADSSFERFIDVEFKNIIQLVYRGQDNITPDLQNKKNDEIYESTLKYIHENFRIDISRDDISEAISVNKTMISRIFKNKTGTSIGDYILKLRMQEAVRLINDGEKISDIYQKVGYNSYRHFAKMFNKYIGCSPNDYRKKMLDDKDIYSY